MIPRDAPNISVFTDGDAICAVYTDKFIDLVQSKAGFGDTVIAAISDLMGRTPVDTSPKPQEIGLNIHKYPKEKYNED
jgi:hypothetical protein